MSREVDTDLSSELALKQFAPVLFVEGDFVDGFVRLWNGIAPLLWDGKVWQGAGQLISLGDIEETTALEATALTVSISSIPSELVAVAYTSYAKGRPVRVWLGAMNVGNGQIKSPALLFSGRMDTIADDDDGRTAIVSITAESNIADLRRPRARFYTDTDQRRIFSGDSSLRYVPVLQEKSIYWGAHQRPGGPGAANE